MADEYSVYIPKKNEVTAVPECDKTSEFESENGETSPTLQTNEDEVGASNNYNSTVNFASPDVLLETQKEPVSSNSPGIPGGETSSQHGIYASNSITSSPSPYYDSSHNYSTYSSVHPKTFVEADPESPSEAKPTSNEYDLLYGNEPQLPSKYSYGVSIVPKVSIRLFVQNIPLNMEADAIKPVFEEFGPVTEATVLRDKGETEHRGNGFVVMESLTDADRAIRELNGKKSFEEGNEPMQIRYATTEVEKLGIPPDNAVPGVDQSRLFIGSLSRQADEEHVKSLFSTICPVEEVYVIRESGTGSSRGCAFVVLPSKEMALYAIKCLNGTDQLSASRPLEVRFADVKMKQPTGSSAVGVTSTMDHNGYAQSNMATGASHLAGGTAGHQEPAYSAYVAPTNYGQPDLSRGAQQTLPRPNAGAAGMPAAASTGPITVTSGLANTNPRRRDGWLEFFSEDGTPYYYHEVMQTSQWDKPENFDTPGPPGANLFIFHVPSEWGVRELIYHFRPYGEVVSATIAADKQTGRNKGYAFVSYTDIQSAVNAIQEKNGYSVGNKRLKVAIKQNEENYAAHLLHSNRPAYGSATGSRVPLNATPKAYPQQGRSYAAPY